MAENKDFWHDVRVSITKDLIVKAVFFILGLPVVLVIIATAAQSVRDWLLGDSHMLHWAVVLLVWLLLIAFAAVARLGYTLYRERATRNAAAIPTKQPPAPVRFAPDTFELTPARRRALLVLRNRVDARTTLSDLHRLVTDQDGYFDHQLTKAQLQHDMEAAEGAGIVSIDRVGTLTQHYILATPDGRDWVLSKQQELQADARKGMTRKDPGKRYF